jgi:quercetin dioxygenase-like cupin family protein
MLPSEFSRLSNKCGSLEQSIAVNDFPGTVDLGRAAAERPIYGTSGRFTRTIVELAGKVLLVWMRKGARWTEHQTPGRITVQTLGGSIRLHARGKVFALPERHLLALDSKVAHDVEALEESGFLLTVARPETPARPESSSREG